MNYNHVLFLLMGFWGAIDGYVNITTPFTTSKILQENHQSQATITSVIFVGMLLGNFITPFIQINRKLILIILVTAISIVLAAQAIVENIIIYTILKLIEQIIIKLGMTFSFTQLTLTNSKIHITLVGIQYTLGELYAIILLDFNYKISLSITSLISFIYLILYFILLKDENTQTKKEQSKPKQKMQLDRKILVSLALQSFFINFIFAGIYYILPKISSNTNNSALIYSTLSTIPNVFLAAIFIRILGNRNALTLSFSSITFFMATIFLYEDYYFNSAISAARLSLMLTFTFFFSFAGTQIKEEQRESILGLSLGFGRLGSIAMPWVINYLYQEGKFIPFLGFGLSSFIGMIIAIMN